MYLHVYALKIIQTWCLEVSKNETWARSGGLEHHSASGTQRRRTIFLETDAIWRHLVDFGRHCETHWILTGV